MERKSIGQKKLLNIGLLWFKMEIEGISNRGDVVAHLAARLVLLNGMEHVYVNPQGIMSLVDLDLVTFFF